MKEKIENLYLSFMNDFLTVDHFANCHRISYERAKRIIKIGREINNAKRIKLSNG